MTKEYLSKFIGYYSGFYYDYCHYDFIILIRPWYLPNKKLVFKAPYYGQNRSYEDALSKVKEYFDGK